MPTTGNRSIGWALAALSLIVLTGGAHAGSFTRGCAARDIQVLNLVEERASTGAISPQSSTEAVLEVLHARMVCFEGRVVEALAIYDTVSDRIAPTAVLSGRQP